ncbi:hypothetical protein DMP14_22790 [Pseudonocardia sp. Ae707_Ps2]|uniref:Zn-ribbon domain-containing OB-fold protein n=1 Tax=Pseudonocardia sp. Ae707_Ps2 TaxID=2212992 RepID=UPI00307D2D34
MSDTTTDPATGRTAPVLGDGVPDDLPAVVARHGQVVAAGDLKATLADFRPDRVGQLVASARLPRTMVGSEVLSIERQADGLMAAHIRYRHADGDTTVLRSRWVRLPQGWRVSEVRNVPDTPPVLEPLPAYDDDLHAPHRAGLAAGELRIQRCGRCGEWIWAPRALCPACHGTDLDWPVVEPSGSVYSWTRTWQPFAREVSGHVPYVVVLVELDGAGRRRVLGVLRDGDATTPAVGDRVRGEFDRTGDGAALLRWRIVEGTR